MATRRPPRSGRRFQAALVAAAVAALAIVGSPEGRAAQPRDKVDPALAEQLAADGGEVPFWVLLREEADLGRARGIRDRASRGRFVHAQLMSVAERSQAGLRAFLLSRGAPFDSFWIANTIKVEGNAELVEELAARPEVERIVADGAYEVPRPAPATALPHAEGVEWNVGHIGATQVWSTFGVRGDGIVVGSIDTGVQFDHPALVAHYRGTADDGSVDHDYNWFDPSNVCGSPSLVPCDNNGHGTHTTGTVLGDDGDPGENRIGVAPHARWIAAKGCEEFTCSFEALLASSQWMLAPTDLNGENPRPNLRPHVVNNSWGHDDGSDPHFRDVVQAWVAAGIFPVFANGNRGSGCGSVSSPASYPESYGVGAHDAADKIAGFSGRGPSPFDGITKPDITAPGVDIRSSWSGGGYAALEGTSMATPHVTGTVALMWSAAPSLIGDVRATRAVLAKTAIDASDLTCGGVPGNNNVWGEGRLDAFAAVDQSPRPTAGILTGTVTDGSNGAPVPGATIEADGPGSRSTTSDASGQFALVLEAGSYDVSVAAFGFVSGSATVAVESGQTTVYDSSLSRAPSHTLMGTVRDTSGDPVAGARVMILDTPIAPALTRADGSYGFADVPVGEYDVEADAGGCKASRTKHVSIDRGTRLDFALRQRVDSFGYSCDTGQAEWIEADTVGVLDDEEDGSFETELPFPFELYGRPYERVHVYVNGLLEFLGRTDATMTWRNGPIPAIEQPNAAVYAFWDDLHVDAAQGASIRTELVGTRPNRRFVIEWHNVHPRVGLNPQPTPRIDFEVVLYEDGRILMQYRNIDGADARESGDSATIGIENESGTVAFQYALNERSISDGLAVLYKLPPSGFLKGRVVEPNAGPVAGATVAAIADARVVRDTTTNAQGFYRLRAPLGAYELQASKERYIGAQTQVVLDEENETVRRVFSIRTAHASVSPATLALSLPRNTTATKTIRLVNSGSAPMAWELVEFGQDSGADPGDVVRSWPATGTLGPWGVAYDGGNIWVSDSVLKRNVEFTRAGSPTGRSHDARWSVDFPADLAFDSTHDCMAQVNFGGDNGIYCWSVKAGSVRYSIAGDFPWTAEPQLGLAYNPDDDTFFIGGWNSDTLFRVKGSSHPDEGAVVSRCKPAGDDLAGLAWNPWFEVLWAVARGDQDEIQQLDPESCAVLDTLPSPTFEFGATGLDLDRDGDLLLADPAGGDPGLIHQIETGVRAFSDLPWLSATPASGRLRTGGSRQIEVTLDTTGLAPGIQRANLVVLSNSGRRPQLLLPVTLTVRN